MYSAIGRSAVSSSILLSLVMNLCIDESVAGTQCDNGSSESMISTLVNNKADSY